MEENSWTNENYIIIITRKSIVTYKHNVGKEGGFCEISINLNKLVIICKGKQEKRGNNMKHKLKLIRENNTYGITLIALVITIIVLLILAGVSIAILTGQNGLLTRANEAKKETEQTGYEEIKKIMQMEARTCAL